VSKPTITVYRPAKDKDSGAAMVICPGAARGRLIGSVRWSIRSVLEKMKMTSFDPVVAYTEFLGGNVRPVYEDHHGQYVIADDGEPVRGVWFIPRDEADAPAIVEAPKTKD
jgi:hypothetical protein